MTTMKIESIKVLEQPRKDFSSVDALAQNIKQLGLLVPPLVRKNGTEFVLIDGECRIRACKKLGMTEIEVRIINSEKEISETEAKEMQMMANLCRADLSLVERMRGFSNLLHDAPEKYNALVVARKFGFKEKEINKMVGVIRRISIEVDVEIASGRFDFEDMEELAKIPAAFQMQVVKYAAKQGHANIRQAIYNLTEELHFDSVFGEEQARASGKIHFKPSYGLPRTFDKAYAKIIKDEYEKRTKKKYDDEKSKAKGVAEKQKELTVEQKAKAREKKKAESAAGYKALKDTFLHFMGRKSTSAQTEEIIQRELRNVPSGDLKLLLRSFGYEKPFADMSTEDIRKLTQKQVLSPLGMNASQLLNFIELVHLQRPYGTDASGWAKILKKEL